MNEIKVLNKISDITKELDKNMLQMWVYHGDGWNVTFETDIHQSRTQQKNHEVKG